MKSFRIWKNTRGSAIIEFVFLFPVFLLLIFAVITFGYWFVVYEADGRAVNSVSQIISTTAATDAAQATLSDGNGNPSQSLARIATSLIGYNNESGLNTGFLCAKSFNTFTEAQNFTSNRTCTADKHWNTQPPSSPISVYYVAVYGTVTVKLPVPAIFEWMKDGNKTMAFTQNTVATVGSSSTPPQRKWAYSTSLNGVTFSNMSNFSKQNTNNYEIIVQFSDPNQNGCGNNPNTGGNDYNNGLELRISGGSNGPWNINDNVLSYWSQGNSTHGGTVSATIPPNYWYNVNCDRGNFDPNSLLAIYE